MPIKFRVFEEGELASQKITNNPLVKNKQVHSMNFYKTAWSVISRLTIKDESPLVSALMVTRGEISFVKRAIKLFENQSWSNKELIIISVNKNEEIISAIEESKCKIVFHLVPDGLTLGELRNISISHANGDFLIMWDDDDLYHKDRILTMMNVLRESNADLAFLSKLQLYWISKKKLALSHTRMWEGSVIMKRSASIIYPSLNKGEDTPVVTHQIKKHKIALVNAPYLYTYCITGLNTHDKNHFENMFNQGKIYSSLDADNIKGKLNYFKYIKQ